MSLKKIEQIKTNKFFKLWDLLVYGLIAAVIVVLFLSIFFTSDKSALSGIEVYYDNNLIFTYSFEDDSYTILSQENITAEEGEQSLTLYFSTDDGKGHNTIYIDKSAVTVSVTEADCSNRKDCVYMSDLKDNSGVIVCSPHRLKIMPSGYSDDGTTLPVG